MFFFTSVFLLSIAGIFFTVRYANSHPITSDGYHKSTTYWSREGNPILRFWLLILSVASFIAIVIAGLTATGTMIGVANNVDNSAVVLEELNGQRQEILKILNEELDNEDYIALIDAATPEDVAFLHQNPQVSDYLLGRVDRLTQVNAQLFTERRNLLRDARRVCNNIQNPLVPMIPFLSPECNLSVATIEEAPAPES